MSVQPDAQFWHAEEDGDVQCSLCYRRCQLAPGEPGFCKLRTNVDGRLTIPQHGVLGAFLPFIEPTFTWRQGTLSAWVNGISCTSHCSFCGSGDLALHPECMPAPAVRPDTWSHERHRMQPEEVIETALSWNATNVHIGGNEPTLTIEYTLEVAKLAKAAGLYVTVDTNGFASLSAVEQLAPFVDMAFIGVKGQLAPDFYERRMLAGGAVPHVLASMELWHASPTTFLHVSDIMPPRHWVDDADFERYARRFYSWITKVLGPLQPLEIFAMFNPKTYRGLSGQAMLPRNATPADRRAFAARWRLAVELACDCGLEYAYRVRPQEVTCHACGALLWSERDGYVISDSTCAGCGVAVPLVPAARASPARRVPA